MTDEPTRSSSVAGATSPDDTALASTLAGSSLRDSPAALLVGMGLLMLGNGLSASLLGIRSASEGFGNLVTGAVMASYFAGFFVGSRHAVLWLAKVGHIRVFAALASTASSVLLLHAIAPNALLWAALRFVFGGCMAGLYVVAESWLNAHASHTSRGRLLAIYMIATMGGLAGGQFLLRVADPDGYELFVLASILVSMSLVPMSLSATSPRQPDAPELVSLRSLFAVVPTGVVGSFWVGASTGTMVGMGAVHATAVGFDAADTATFMAAPLLGAIAFQWPVGWFADRLPRRGVMVVLAVGAAAAAVLLLFVDDDLGPAVEASMFVLGGSSYSLYSLVIAYSNDWLQPHEIVGASATLIRINGAGAMLGPLLTAVLMDAFGAPMFFVVLVGTHGAIAGHLAYRIVRADAIPVDRQRPFVAFPARGGALAAALLPRARADRRASR